MATNYDVVSARDTIEALGGIQTRPVYQVGATTKPNGVYWVRRFPVAEFSQIGEPTRIDPLVIDAELNTDAVFIEETLQLPNVIAIVYIQDQNAAGFLIDILEITVGDASGTVLETLRWPVANLSIGLITDAVSRVSADADAIKAL